jgi:Ca-activated chloride channel family protein
VKLLDQDLRVVLCWDADLTDVDLWVTEPNGERCYFSNNRTRMGGRISRDFTQGYGPEEYIVRRGMSGVYRIQANYYGSSQQTLTGPATVLATVFTNFGRPDEDRRVITVRVTEVKDVIDVGEVELQTS